MVHKNLRFADRGNLRIWDVPLLCGILQARIPPARRRQPLFPFLLSPRPSARRVRLARRCGAVEHGVKVEVPLRRRRRVRHPRGDRVAHGHAAYLEGRPTAAERLAVRLALHNEGTVLRALCRGSVVHLGDELQAARR